MNPNNPNNNANNDQDKTVVFSSSSSSANTSKPLDQTVVDNSPAGGAPKAAQPTPEPPKDASAGTQPPTNKPTTNKKGYSSGQMAAGVAGAGIAGAALGAAFSDDIQSAFQSSDATTEGEASDMGAAAQSSDTLSNEPVSHMDIQTTDAEGNVYNVSMSDTDGDGQFDFTEGEAILVDGTNVHFEYHGDPLSALMSGEIAIAETADYQQMAEEGGFDCCYIHNEPFSYEIQSGDTLSEIAAANHTSVARLMELNPHITDPDVIYSGDNIQIPSNDNISNPYEGGVGLSDDSNNDVVEVSLEDLQEDSNDWVEEPVEVTNDIIETSSETETGEFVIESTEELESETGEFVSEGFEDPETVLSGEEVDTASNPDDFSAIDWDSFEDNQASPDSYESELANANFDSYEMPDSYQDNAFYGGDADMANADFI